LRFEPVGDQAYVRDHTLCLQVRTRAAGSKIDGESRAITIRRATRRLVMANVSSVDTDVSKDGSERCLMNKVRIDGSPRSKTIGQNVGTNFS
jgi:hypothetical protein